MIELFIKRNFMYENKQIIQNKFYHLKVSFRKS